MHIRLARLPYPLHKAFLIATFGIAISPLGIVGSSIDAQAPADVSATASPLTLREALDLARRNNPDLVAAREALAAASGRQRQAAAHPNPTVSYQHEQTGRSGNRNSQNIASVDQVVEIGGVRGARRSAADLRRQAADARLASAGAQVDFEVIRAYALVVATDRRATLASEAAADFSKARTASNARLAEGDISGYADRRVRLEAARYGGLLAQALVERRTARMALAALIGSASDSGTVLDVVLVDSIAVPAVSLSQDSLSALAAEHRAELTAALLDAEAAAADTRLATRERVPSPMLSLGLKNEAVVGAGQLRGFIAGVSIPLPLWDRRRGAIEAAGATARQRVAEAEVLRRRIAREIVEAFEGLRAVQEQLALLTPQLGTESAAALNSARVAYAEGEISLVEWLDAVRAYRRRNPALRRFALNHSSDAPHWSVPSVSSFRGECACLWKGRHR